jgi:hypothetical protein
MHNPIIKISESVVVIAVSRHKLSINCKNTPNLVYYSLTNDNITSQGNSQFTGIPQQRRNITMLIITGDCRKSREQFRISVEGSNKDKSKCSLMKPAPATIHHWCKWWEISATSKTNKLHGLSPRANYTDRAIAACRRSDCQLVRIENATWSAWRIPTTAFSVF